MHSGQRLTRHHAATAILALAIVACMSPVEPPPPTNPATETYAASLGVDIAQMTKKSDHLYIQDLVVGTGAAAIAGKTVEVTYTGWLANGTEFDSNVGDLAFSFTLGTGYVIDGWDQGVVGMKVGGTRRLVIGSALGYGSRGNLPIIPPNSTLVFDVQLSSVR